MPARIPAESQKEHLNLNWYCKVLWEGAIDQRGLEEDSPRPVDSGGPYLSLRGTAPGAEKSHAKNIFGLTRLDAKARADNTS